MMGWSASAVLYGKRVRKSRVTQLPAGKHDQDRTGRDTSVPADVHH